MKHPLILVIAALCLAAAHVVCAQATAPPMATPVTITVQPGARQAFRGLGVSEFNYGSPGAGTFDQLTPARRALLWDLIYRDLKIKTLRLWWNPEAFAPQPGWQDMAPFVSAFVAGHLLADARARGVTTLLLAPDRVPASMLSDPQDHNSRIRDTEIGSYVTLIATLIQRLKAEHGVAIDATGIANEPPWFDPAQMVTAVKDLRAELDRRGLKRVMIVAPENPNNDGTTDEYLKALKADPQAWQALEGIATHSYNMAPRPEEAAIVEGTDKEFWITEAGGGGLSLPGSETPIDPLEAASAASRFLNDMNQRATRWVWFIGVMDITRYPVDFDNVQRLIEFQPQRSADWYAPLLKYYYLRRLSETFDVGAVFRHSVSSLEGEMTYTYGRKPRLNAAAARNPDGTWAVGLSNFTGEGFLQDTQTNRDNAGYPPQFLTVTLQVPELAGAGDITFRVHRNSAPLRDMDEGTVMMHNGQVTLTVAPTELVTLRSVKGIR
ncbi:MAG: hypothetical protein JO250_16395 [Armatimonadetes bacterium]|nr:hypothetical protein [Armatimonadota bacterium]